MTKVECPTEERRRRPIGAIALPLIVVAIIAVPFFLRLSLLKTRGFNPDELEHVHWSWCVSKDMVPYRDYFDHHTPWLHYFLARFFATYDVERIEEDAIGFLIMARRWMWFSTGVLLALTFALARSWRNTRTGLVAALALANAAFFLSKSLEIRPDVPAAGLLVGAVLASLGGLRRSGSGARGGPWMWFVSGLLLGAATMFTQKVLFAGPGFALVALWFLFDRRLSVKGWERVRLLALQGAGTACPVVGTLAFFAIQGAAWRFIDFNFLLNARWPGLSAGPFLVELVRQDRFFVLLAVVGFLAGIPRLLQAEGARRGEPVVALVTLSLFATLPLHPAMSYQHFLHLLPFAALYAGAALVSLVDRMVGLFEYRARTLPSGIWAVGAVVIGSAACYGLLQALPPSDLTLPPAVMALVAATVLALPFFIWRGAQNATLALLVLLMSVHPMERFRNAFQRGNWGTLQAIGYVLRNTAPWETTFDGFTGLGLYRPQAFFHHFQHPHAFALQTEEEHRDMLEALQTGRAMPKLIFWTHYLRDSVTPEMAAFLETHYVPTGLEPIRVRPFDNGIGWWSDEETRYLGWVPGEERAPHVLFGEGWRAPDIEYGVPVRRTRTRKSKLIVPIRYPRDFQVILRARADAEAVPFGVELVVNGRAAGFQDAQPRWQDYEFGVTVHQLRPGFNEIEIRFSSGNNADDRRLELAAHSLRLVPVTAGAER